MTRTLGIAIGVLLAAGMAAAPTILSPAHTAAPTGDRPEAAPATGAPAAPGSRVGERGQPGAASVRAEDLYRAAVHSRRWESMLEAGDASVRADNVPMARRAYLLAFTWARRADSVEGTLRVAASLAALGDVEAVARLARAAEEIAARRPQPLTGGARVREAGVSLVARAQAARQAQASAR